MDRLEQNATLRELQSYIATIEVERGFVDQTTVQKCLLLGEEVGELFKAVRHLSGMGTDVAGAARDVAEELADVLIFLLAIANRCNVDLSTALIDKEQKNRTRTWV